jgi:uncharacterized 2Fe-2S/4Fe-4S cluster protein (DUF4445 family)
MSRIIVADRNIEIHAPEGKNLLDILISRKIFVDNPCGGNGICGKCKILLLDGNLPPPSESERSALSAEEIASNCRLACAVQPAGDITIKVPHEEREHKILSDGFMPNFSFEASVRKKLVTISKQTLSDHAPYEKLFAEASGVGELDLSILRNLSPSDGEWTLVFCEDKLIGVEPGDTTDKIYGIALDIGTTTVVASLVDITAGKELAVQSVINPQKLRGLDVLSRIAYIQERGEDGKRELQRVIAEALGEMIEKLCDESGVESRRVYLVSVAANATMLHLFLGIDPTSMGRAPFSPVFVRGKKIRASDVGLTLANGAVIHCLPSVSSYIGADIVAGVYVCGMAKERDGRKILFIDIGTNGEIVLARDGRLLSCSCAAGPALEGMNISCGMRAAVGAVEDIKITGCEIGLKVIGNAPPVGICGSGILGAVRELLEVGLIRENGSLLREKDLQPSDPRRSLCFSRNGKPAIRLCGEPCEIFITQDDIRQVQLAKGAILSGFLVLLESAGLGMNDLDRVLVAGQFGAHLPAESLTGCGILPGVLKDRIEYLGNSSKTGAYIAMMSLPARMEMEALSELIEYVELSVYPNYERIFAKCLAFKDG